MSESGRDPLIRLPIDQEIFSQVVREGDTVEDATVAAEVISLEREGLVYEIEGAIVFAGYVRRTTDEAGTLEAVEEDVVEHLHHRLPFTLRVPVEAQSSNVINIKSRLSGFALNIVSDNWLNVQGNLEIHGLRADEGYHFRCGGQEEGTAFFSEQSEQQETEDAVTPEVNQSQPETEEDEADLFAVVGENEWRSAPEDEQDAEVEPAGLEETTSELAFRGQSDDTDDERGHEEFLGEKVSEARQGHGWSEEQAQADARSSAPSQDAVEPIRNELAHLDRHFVSQPEPDATEQNRSEQNPVEAKKEPIASFEFEHQLEEDVETNSETTQSQVRDVAPVEMRADAESAEEAWRPRFTIASAVRDAAPEEESQVPVVDEADRHEMAANAAMVTDSDLWSFVDFNGPEPRHTLRYVIVMEEETMELVAERCGCVTSELERVNAWTQGQIRPGQALYIPSKPFSIPQVTVS